MEKRITRLSEEMDKHLRDLEEKYDDMGVLARNATILLSEVIETLQEFISGHAFDDQTEEIAFFRNVNTRFYGKLYIYYHHICQIEEIKRANIGSSIRQQLLREQLLKIDRFFKQNLDFISYY